LLRMTCPQPRCLGWAIQLQLWIIRFNWPNNLGRYEYRNIECVDELYSLVRRSIIGLQIGYPKLSEIAEET